MLLLIKPKGPPAVQFAARFRRTTELEDWLADFGAVPNRRAGRGIVREGFEDALKPVWDKITGSLAENVPPGCPLFIAGHGLGAALATLAGSLLQPRGLHFSGLIQQL